MKTKDTWKKLGMDLAKVHNMQQCLDSGYRDRDESLDDYIRRARALRSAERKRTKLSQFLAGKRSSRGLEKVIREDKRKGASRG